MKKVLIILLSILVAQQVLAEPGPAIAKLIQTPATVFDMFLYRFYESAKCNNVMKNNNSDEADLCLSAIKYDADKNILSIFVRVLPGAEAMDDFVAEELDERREILLTLLDNTARRVGVVDTWGLMHSIPISHGWNGSQADEKAFRAELAKRTTTILSTSYDGAVYIATRHHDGEIEYIVN